MAIGASEDAIIGYQQLIQYIPQHLFGSKNIYLTRKTIDKLVDAYLKQLESLHTTS